MNNFSLRTLKFAIKHIANLLILLISAVAAVSVQAAPMVTDAKLFAGNDGIYSFDMTLSASVEYNAFLLGSPNRVVIDLDGIKASSAIKRLPSRTLPPGSKIIRIRTGHPAAGITRIVFDLDYLPPNVDAHLHPVGGGKHHPARGTQHLVVTWSQAVSPQADKVVGAVEQPKLEPEINVTEQAPPKAVLPEAENVSHNIGTPVEAQAAPEADAKIAVAQAEPGAAPAQLKSADHAGWYALVGAGRSIGNNDQSSFDSAVTSGGGAGFTSTFTEPTFYKLQLGYQVSKHFALEGGYLTTSNETYSASGGNLVGTLSAFANVSGFNLVAVGKVPLSGSISLLGRIGIADLTASGTVSGGGITVNASGTKTDATYGIGAQYDFTRHFFGRFNIDSYSIGSSTASSRGNVWTVDAGVKL